MIDPNLPFKLKLRNLCGFIENGTDTTVSISQDDATKHWILKVGKRSYYGFTFIDAFNEAFADEANDPFKEKC